MIDYPDKLNTLFNKLHTLNIKPIIIGGYVRDRLLHLDSKDIDIELYGLEKLEDLEIILQEFGEVNSVGKSFGVCKLNFEGLEIDFSLPREDSKVASGHKGFSVKTDSTLDFKTATSRRDFKMNAIGYDVISKELLDPFNGIQDIKNRVISAVDLRKFSEDPLRVLRAISFAGRFSFRLDTALFSLCKEMIKENILNELPKERVYEEIKKLLLKSKKPSIGFQLLEDLHSKLYFKEFENRLTAVNYLAKKNIKDDKKRLNIFFAILSYDFNEKERLQFLHLLTESKDTLKYTSALLKEKNSLDLKNFTDYDIYILATKVEIESFLYFIDAITLGTYTKEIETVKRRAIELKVLHKQADSILKGRDLLKLGLKPSKEFSKILQTAYIAQLKSKFITHREATNWLKKFLDHSHI